MTRLEALPGYETLARILDLALKQAQSGKGLERHASDNEKFDDQQIVQLGEWMKSTHFNVGQICKKALESTRLVDSQAVDELLGVIDYAAGAIAILQRRAGTPPVEQVESVDERCDCIHSIHGRCILNVRHVEPGSVAHTLAGMAHRAGNDERWR